MERGAVQDRDTLLVKDFDGASSQGDGLVAAE